MTAEEGQICPDCAREYPGPDYDGESGFCVAPWSEDKACLRLTVTRLKSELAAARAVIEAAEAMREDTCHGNALEAFDAALAEWRRVKG